jgi:hypothetical protein
VKDKEIKAIREGGWGKILLSYRKKKYYALDSRIGFDLARKKWQLVGYDVEQFFHALNCNCTASG